MTINSEAEFNEQQVCWAIIALFYAYWKEEIHPQIARSEASKLTMYESTPLAIYGFSGEALCTMAEY